MWQFNSLSSISTCTEKSPLKKFSCCATDFPSSADFTCSLIFSPAFLRYNWQGIYIFKPQGKRNPELPRIIFYWLGTHFGICIFNQLGDFDDQTVLGMWVFFFFFPSAFLFLFPSVNCFSTLFFSENHFLLTVDLIQRLRPSRPRQQSCVLGGGQCSHSGPFPSSSAKAQSLHLCAATNRLSSPQQGRPPSAVVLRGEGNPTLSLHFPQRSQLCPRPWGFQGWGRIQPPLTYRAKTVLSEPAEMWKLGISGHSQEQSSCERAWVDLGQKALGGPGRPHWAGFGGSLVLSGRGSQSLSGWVGSAAPARSHLAQLWEMWRMDFTVV